METEHGLNSQNSSSVLRKPGHPEDFVRGSTLNHPFRPGGFDLPQSSGKTVPEGALNGDWLRGWYLTLSVRFLDSVNNSVHVLVSSKCFK